MKTVNLTLNDRTKAIALLNEGKFNNSTLSVVLEDIKNLAITEAEWELAKLVKTPTEDGKSTIWKWEDEIVMKDVSLDQLTVDAILGLVKDKDDAKQLTLADGPILALKKKLEA